MIYTFTNTKVFDLEKQDETAVIFIKDSAAVYQPCEEAGHSSSRSTRSLFKERFYKVYLLMMVILVCITVAGLLINYYSEVSLEVNDSPTIVLDHKHRFTGVLPFGQRYLSLVVPISVFVTKPVQIPNVYIAQVITESSVNRKSVGHRVEWLGRNATAERTKLWTNAEIVLQGDAVDTCNFSEAASFVSVDIHINVEIETAINIRSYSITQRYEVCCSSQQICRDIKNNENEHTYDSSFDIY